MVIDCKVILRAVRPGSLGGDTRCCLTLVGRERPALGGEKRTQLAALASMLMLELLQDRLRVRRQRGGLLCLQRCGHGRTQHGRGATYLGPAVRKQGGGFGMRACRRLAGETIQGSVQQGITRGLGCQQDFAFAVLRLSKMHWERAG